ncbi:hypothetical protein ENBRE01_1671 [Enteropsectra breve]|nr:hypothetical protein ENBRE01_1671 [Enteropsectra breve]
MDADGALNKIYNGGSATNKELNILRRSMEISATKYQNSESDASDDDLINSIKMYYELEGSLSMNEAALLYAFKKEGTRTAEIDEILLRGWATGKTPAAFSMENLFLKLENLSLKEELAKNKLKLEQLDDQNNILKNKLELLDNAETDRDYEHAMFIEEEVLKRMEQENIRLRRINEEVYGDTVEVWYKMVEDKIKREM